MIIPLHPRVHSSTVNFGIGLGLLASFSEQEKEFTLDQFKYGFTVKYIGFLSQVFSPFQSCAQMSILHIDAEHYVKRDRLDFTWPVSIAHSQIPLLYVQITVTTIQRKISFGYIFMSFCNLYIGFRRRALTFCNVHSRSIKF
jgi:hypothetical protein